MAKGGKFEREGRESEVKGGNRVAREWKTEVEGGKHGGGF